MQAIILAGGLGTRMREETEFKPKPMVEIGGRPVLWHIMKHLSQHGVKDFIVALGYKGSLIREYFLNYETQVNDFTIELGHRNSVQIHDTHDESDWRVTLVDTGINTNTGGRVKMAGKYVHGSQALVTYGDSLADVDITQLMRFHDNYSAEATVTAVMPRSRFGILEVDSQGSVSSFSEKPQIDGWINIGFMLLTKDFIDQLEDDSVLEHEPLSTAARGGSMRAFRHEGFWQPMDTYREYVELNQLWASGQAPWKTW